MPRKRDRTRLRLLLDRLERSLEKRRRRTLEEHKKFLLRYLSRTFREYISLEEKAERTVYEQLYLNWYNAVYKNARAQIIRYSTMKAIRSVKRRDYTNIEEKRSEQRKRIFLFKDMLLKQILASLSSAVHMFPPIRIYKAIHRSIEVMRILHDLRSGKAFIIATTIWKDRNLELVLSQHIDQWLSDPSRIEATSEALHIIFRQLLSTKQRIIIDPQTYERLKGILRTLYRNYVLYARPMPCRRTQMAIKLTPLTLHYFRGYAVRFYIVRWVRTDSIKSGLVEVTEPIDIRFMTYRRLKYRGEVLSTMTIGNEHDSLRKDAPIYLWRDALQIPREMLYAYEAIYLVHRIEDAIRRATGRREADAGVGHCSIYIGFRRMKPYWKTVCRRIERDMWRLYRYD